MKGTLRLQRNLLLSKATKKVLFSTNTNNNWDYDVMICGGGIVGSALASKLLHMTGGTIKIGLIEHTRGPEPFDVCSNNAIPDRRVYALSPKSINILKSLNIGN